MVDETMNEEGRLSMMLSNINEILNSAEMGVFRVILCKGEHPQLRGSLKFRELLGVDADQQLTDEEFYDYWYSRIVPAGTMSLGATFEDILSGNRFEKTYRWNHPTLGLRYVRGGGVTRHNDDGTCVVEGYHQDVTEQMKRSMQDEFIIKSLSNIYSCLFYVDLDKGEYVSYVNNLSFVEQYIPPIGNLHKAIDALLCNLCEPSDRQMLKVFCDLSTLNTRLKDTNYISTYFQSPFLAWTLIAFIVSERHSDGMVKSMVVAVKDVTAMKRKENARLEELRHNIEANQSKTLMLQNMVHEIRTPLNAMFGFSQLLCMPDNPISDEQKQEYFNNIYNSFNMLSMLIDDVLDIVDAEHGNYRMHKEHFAVNAMCCNALLMAEIRRSPNVHMYFTSDVTDDYCIESDSRRIQQVLVNFLTNACKHTQQGEIHLHVSTTETPGRLTFSVTDTGTGIPPEMVKDIFQRYKKADSYVQGSGLGLHICNIIADHLGAEVKVDETYTGGARFLFIL